MSIPVAFLHELGIQEAQIVKEIPDDMMYHFRGNTKEMEKMVRYEMARSMADFLVQNVPIETVQYNYERKTRCRMRFWALDNEAMEKLTGRQIRVAEMPRMEIPDLPKYVPTHISTVPAGRIPDKVTPEMLSAYDDAYNEALFDAKDQTSPEERGIQAVLNLLRK